MQQLLLTDAGQPRGRIILPSTASPTEQHAAHELQTHLAQVSGARLPIETSPADGAASVYIGKTPQTEALLGSFDWAALGEDGVVVRTVQGALVLAGATPRGTLYAVYEFLEEIMGCRWLTAEYSVIPKRQTIALDAIDIVHTPPFRYRETFFSVARDADWAARNRTNGAHAHLDAVRGGKWAYAGFVHTFNELVPPDEYFESHPEYYSELNGQRTTVQSQLCLTNPEVADVVTESARRWLREQPGARVLSISQNDWHGNCQCANCRALDEEEGSPSGAMVRFVNTIAERLEPEFPHVFFDTLAYTYTEAPPRHARPRRNVIIRLCHMTPACDAHPLEKCAMNSKFLGYLQRWGEISPEVFIWDYYTNFSHYFMPFPNLDVLCEDIPLFARAGVTGIFCQGDGSPPKGPGEFAELRAYLLAKLMWRPERDGQQIIKEFLQLYYGAAAGPIGDYINLIHAPVRDGSAHFDLYCGLDQPFLTPEVLAQAEALFDEAARRVEGDAELLERVATARLPIEYIFVKKNLWFTATDTRIGPADAGVAERARQFFTRAIAHGAGSLREGGRSLEDELANLRGHELVTLESDGLKLVIGPSMGGRLLKLTDTRSGQEWMHVPHLDAPDYPFSGGYEEYSGPRWHAPGWREEYSCELSSGAARLSVTLANGLRLNRTYRVENNGVPSLVIESTITNISDTANDGLLRTHPELAMGDIQHSSVRVRTTDGAWLELSPWRSTPEAEGKATGSIWLRGEGVPAGSWTLVRNGHALTIEFEPQQIEKCLLDWRGAEGIIGMELFGNQQRLEPGQSTGVLQRWSFNTP